MPEASQAKMGARVSQMAFHTRGTCHEGKHKGEEWERVTSKLLSILMIVCIGFFLTLAPGFFVLLNTKHFQKVLHEWLHIYPGLSLDKGF